MVKRILHDLVEHCAQCAVDDRLVGAVFRDDDLGAFLRVPARGWDRAPRPGCARSPRPPWHPVSAPCRTRSRSARADRSRTGCAWMYCECVRSRHRSVRGYSPESGLWFGFPFLSFHQSARFPRLGQWNLLPLCCHFMYFHPCA